MSLQNKIDFALVFRVKNANPNGDPLNGNRPRIDYDGRGEVSDVCLKRKLRNRLQSLGENIFVQSDDNRVDQYRSLKDRFDNNAKVKEVGAKSAEDVRKAACKEWYDVRAFGQVFAFKEKKKDKDKKKSESGSEGEESGADAVSIGIRGPVTIQSAFSVNPLITSSVQIVKSVNLETNNPPERKAPDTMGMKHRVNYGVYVTYGGISCQLAEKTGFSDEDAEKLKKALLTLFANDVSAARPEGSMEVVKVIWWKHASKTGQYSSAQVHRSLKVKPDNKSEEIEITVESLANLNAETLDGLNIAYPNEA
ncbi:MAG: type I-C CRISPR-associated protein Cas7/Csd2 [Helicobacteraceae bacterium]|jgi:CRISPR-associated protein Csd2|nr:type I-C CRISPR-associated protein Cas7/Csd2 [Helicobacteraceae bacterium]